MATAYRAHNARLQRLTLLVLYATYASFYLSRKADSVAKMALHEQEGFTMEELAGLDTVYLAVYTVSLACAGLLGGNVRSGSLLACACVCLAFTSFLKSRVRSPSGFAACQVLHAMSQSVGWPTCIKLIGVWVQENRGAVMGVWTTCQSLGGIFGALWATWFMTHKGWQYAYLYHIPILLTCSVVCYNYIEDEPPASLVLPDPAGADAGDAVDAQEDNDMERGQLLSAAAASSTTANKSPQTASSPPISLLRVVAIPGVVSIGVSYFFLKFLRYALLMWLPYYYEEGLHIDPGVAGYMSTSFEMGGLVGTPFIGWYSDRVLKGKRDLTAAWFLGGASIMLMACVVVAHLGVSLNAMCMFVVGILIIGPDSILSGTIAQDLGAQSPMGPKVIGTLAGLINSVGSCGSIFQSYATAYISRYYGWDVLFQGFVLCAIVSASILFNVSNKSAPFTLQQRERVKKLALTILSLGCLFLFWRTRQQPQILR